MTREQTKELIKIMQHYVDGGDVTRQNIDGEGLDWMEDNYPDWIFNYFVYRKAKPRPKLIHNAVYLFTHIKEEYIGIYKEQYTNHFLTNDNIEIETKDCQNIRYYAEPKGDDFK